MTVNAYDASSDRTYEFPKLEELHGEDPARFLESNELMATARIRGIRDPELLEAYDTVAKQITAGSYRTAILEAIDERKVALDISDELPDDPTPDATADPVPATDGGERVAESRSSSEVSSDVGTELSYDESDSPTEPEVPEPDEIHPDADGLEVGQVLVVTRGEQTEYVWPQTDAADEPFILRLFDADGDQQMELTLSQRDLFSHSHDHDSEKRPVGEIDKTAPKLAATNGGESQ